MVIICESLGVRLTSDFAVFEDLDLTVEPGQCVAVIGANGSGKSTLLRCLYGVQEATSGRVLVAGDKPDERSVAFRRKVSVLMDDSDFFPELTPAQHLRLLAGSFGLDEPDVTAMLDDAGLGERSDVSAGQLSAGQRRRLLLLGAIARPYEVLLLDEPERALDVDGKDWLTGLVWRASEEGAATVLATHHPPLLEAADLIVEMG